MSAMLKELPPGVREMHEEIHQERVRLMSLEDTIVLAKPDYCEAAESILAPMMAALQYRYDFRASASYQQMADVKHAAKKLHEALMAADAVEQNS